MFEQKQHAPRGALRPDLLRAGAWETPRGILESEAIGWQAKWAATYLWNDVAGRRPGTYVTSAMQIAAALRRRDARSGGEYLEELSAAGFVELLDKQQGTWTVYVCDPDQVTSTRRVDPPSEHQRELFNIPEEGNPSREYQNESDGQSAVLAARERPSVIRAGGAGEPSAEYPGICAQKSPGKTAQKSPDRHGSEFLEISEQERREFNLHVLACLQKGLPPPSEAGFFAQKSPARGLQNLNLNFLKRSRDTRNLNLGAGEKCAQKPGDVAGGESPGDPFAEGSGRRREESLVEHLAGLCQRALRSIYEARGLAMPAKPPATVSLGTCRRVARAILDEGLKLEPFVDVIDNARSSLRSCQKPPHELVYYVIGGWQKVFQQHGHAWPRRAAKRER